MASLTEALYALPTERLRTLVQTRKMDLKKLALIPNKRQLVQFLATELNKPASVGQAILRCNARQLRLLQVLLMGETEQYISWNALVEVVGGQSLESAVRAVVTDLEDLGLAFGMTQGVYMPAAVRQQIPASLPDRYTLVRCLNNYDSASLKVICDNLGLPTETKPANVEAIRCHLLGDGSGLRLRRPLDAQERDVLEYLLTVGGAATPIEVASGALGGLADDFFRYDWQNRWKQGRERNAIDCLLARGILHVVAYGYGFNLLLVIPGDLLRALSGDSDGAFWSGPAPAPQSRSEAPRSATRHSSLVRDVVGLLGFITSQEAPRTNTGHIHKTSLKNLARQLSLPDERYTTFIYALARDADLIGPLGEKQLYSITSKGNSWLTWDSLTQTRTLFEAWRKGMVWAEMCSDPLYKAGEYRQHDAIVDMRESVLGVVIAAGGGAWLDLSSVTDTLTFRYPLMLARGVNMAGDLVASPSVFVRLLITECLLWLGMVELGWDTSSGVTALSITTVGSAPALPELQAYRLNAMGLHLLGLPADDSVENEPREDQFIVQANCEIFVPPYLEPATYYHLLALTDTPKGSTGNTVSITRESVRRCLDRGDTVRDILAFLQTHARTGIPQNVEYLINEVGGKHGHIHIGKAQMYLQVDTPLLLKELQARKEITPYIVRTLGDTVALLNASEPEKLLRELRKAGYLPISDDAPHIRTLGVKARPAPQPAPPPTTSQQKQVKRAVKADAMVDWDRIAQEDGRAWHEGRSETPVNSVVRNPELIKILLRHKAKTGGTVEVELASSAGADARRVTFTPGSVVSNQVTGHDEDGNYVFYPLSNLTWARAAD